MCRLGQLPQFLECRYLARTVNFRPLAQLGKHLRASTRNALELARLGRLGEAQAAPYEVIARGPHHRVRKYATTLAPNAPPLVLVPPLMLTAEVYDVAPEISAVTTLGQLGIAPYVVDFGAPEREKDGMRRTLDDHVRAVVQAIETVRAHTGRDVYLAGYSQGGMFAYQAAAYLRSEGIKAVITFGSPVDIHRNLPAVSRDVASALARFVEPWVMAAAERIEGLPGILTATGFKLLSPRKEIQQRIDFVRKLHDRNALIRRESRRRFLGGEGFVAWPGPAFRAFVEEFVIHNRMLSGGFVIDGRTITLADIHCPILAFLGDTDDFARPPTVRAIAQAAPDAEVDFVRLPAGHFGLVVGSRAMNFTWPTVASYIHYREGTAPKPRALRSDAETKLDDELEAGDFDLELELFVDTMIASLRSAWQRLGDFVASTSDAFDAVRFQEPRLRKLAEIHPEERLSPARALAHQAEKTPDATFFLWRGRAFSYREADQRVTNVAKGLWSLGVRPGDRVAVVMGSRPSFLSMVTALDRLGAVAVIAPPEADKDALARAFTSLEVRFVAADPERAPSLHQTFGREILVLGGGGTARELPQGLIDMEALDPSAIEIPEAIELNPGRARDLAMILLRPTEGGGLREATITNHRWALSAYGAAAACTLKPADTVYCCIPLHHPTGVIVSVGAALVSGARLALGETFTPKTFMVDVRRTGATVVFYAGEMLRALLHEKPGRGDRTLPVRLFAGSGMRPDLAARLRERFGIPVLEFYAGTTQNVVLAHASGEKPGALGRPFPGSAPIAIARFDLAKKEPVRSRDGYLMPVRRGEPGVLVAEVEGDERLSENVLEGAFAPGDRWFVSNDVVVEDEDGDIWFVDSLSGFVATKDGPVSTRAVEAALYAIPAVELAASWGAGEGEDAHVVAAYVAKEKLDDKVVEQALAQLEPHARPRRVVHLESMPMTDGFRPNKGALRRMAI